MSGLLVAGLGNIFQGDDAFGVEVIARLTRKPPPAGVKIVDFGIRGLDLTYALTGGYRAAILIDAAQRGLEPGTVSIFEPNAAQSGDADGLAPEDLMISGHDLDPAKVLKVVAMLGGGCERIVLVACEPLDLGGQDGRMGLSAPVAAAIELAVKAVEDLIAAYVLDQKAAKAA